MYLKDSVIGVHAKYPQNGNTFLLLDASDKPIKLNYGKDGDINVKLDPKMDLSKYEAYSFRVYTIDEKAVGKVLRLSFVSPATAENPCNFYHLPLTIMNVGYNYYSGLLVEPERRLEPSWENIIQFNIHHNDIKTNENPELELDSFVLYEKKEDVYHSSHLAVLKDAAAFSVNGCRGIYNDRQYEINKYNRKARVYSKNGIYWLPLSVFAAYNDENAQYDREEKVLTMTYNGKLYKFTDKSSNVELNNDTLFISHTYAMELFGFNYLYTNKFGMIILSKDEKIYDEEKDLSTLLDISYTTLFERPTSDEIIEDIELNANYQITHPRLLLNDDDFNRIRGYYNSDKIYIEYVNELLASYGKESNEFNSLPIDYDTISKKRYFATNLLSRVATWSMLYRLNGNTSYAERAWQEVETVCNYPDWIDYHFLTTSEICISVSLVYDWLFDFLSEEQKKIIETAIYQKALVPGLDRYEGRERIWPNNNWNGICNAGMTIGALAILEIFPEIAKKILGYGIINIEKSLYTFAPDAAHSESAMYWEYHVKYYHMYLAALEKAAGRIYGLELSPGFLESAYFAYHVQTECGSWPFHDSFGDIVINNYLFWFANKTDDQFLSKLRHEQILRAKEVRLNPPREATDDIGLAASYFDLMWYKPFDINAKENNLPLDKYYRGIDIFTSRSGWCKGSTLVGLHGGDNSSSHGDLDTGTFLLYSNGHKFFDDLGKENYDVEGYFAYPPDRRWQYYRKRAEGHNTIVITTGDCKVPDQSLVSDSKLVKMESAPKAPDSQDSPDSQDGALAIFDITSGYLINNPVKMLRGILYKDNRSTIVLQDEIKLNSKEVITWSAHTRSKFDVKFIDDGRVALINAGDCLLYCEIVSDNKKLEFTLADAESFDKSYKYDPVEYKRSDYKKLLIQTKEPVDTLDLAIVFKIIENDVDIPKSNFLYNFTKMSDWHI